MIDTCQAFETLSNYQMELIRSLVNAGVHFVVVGGYAVRYHGHLRPTERPTEDLDLFLDRSSANLTGPKVWGQVLHCELTQRPCRTPGLQPTPYSLRCGFQARLKPGVRLQSSKGT